MSGVDKHRRKVELDLAGPRPALHVQAESPAVGGALNGRAVTLVSHVVTEPNPSAVAKRAGLVCHGQRALCDASTVEAI